MRRKRGADKTAEEKQDQKKLKRRLNKLKSKERKNKEKLTQNKVGNTGSSNGMTEGEGPEKKKQKLDAHETLNGETLLNNEGKIVYSKFDFATATNKSGEKKNKKENRNKLTGRDYGRLLNKVEKREKTLQNLEKKDKEKAGKLKETIQWDAALQRAEGIKVKDNVKLLKKSLKQKEKKKERSKKQWKKREETERKRKEQRQEKRKKNIKQRSETRKQKKLKKK